MGTVGDDRRGAGVCPQIAQMGTGFFLGGGRAEGGWTGFAGWGERGRVAMAGLANLTPCSPSGRCSIGGRDPGARSGPRGNTPACGHPGYFPTAPPRTFSGRIVFRSRGNHLVFPTQTGARLSRYDCEFRAIPGGPRLDTCSGDPADPMGTGSVEQLAPEHGAGEGSCFDWTRLRLLGNPKPDANACIA